MNESKNTTTSTGSAGSLLNPEALLPGQTASDLSAYVELHGQRYYRIPDSHLMPEFFMSLCSSGDHWMFISSHGALTAGRGNADAALFPYYSADKLSDMRSSTGSLTVIRVTLPCGETVIWKPFSTGSQHRDYCRQNLYKNEFGNKLWFEEINERLGLTFRYQWTFGERRGFVRTSELVNSGEAGCQINILDGLQNLMPCGIDRNFQLRFSNLADAYKKNELIEPGRIGVFYFSSIPTDRAEPSEGLRATVIWQTGSTPQAILLSTRQLARFENSGEIEQESNVCGGRGAWLAKQQFRLETGQSKDWMIVATINQDQTDVINLQQLLAESARPHELIGEDIEQCEKKLLKIISEADGRQLGRDLLRVNRHQSNVLFNVMRGGIPANGYKVDSSDFRKHVRHFNTAVYERCGSFLEDLPCDIDIDELIQKLSDQNEPDLMRLGLEYLPFCFSRRHGDPTRPWNAFDIRLMAPDGSLNLDYQGNWRDIFQNWEALALSWPQFATNMVFRFVNASTADGYNPYRITKQGFEWEAPEPDDPWANIGYWGDHQIIYLLKLLEWSYRFDPEHLDQWLDSEYCTYAQIPYRIRSFDRICDNPRETIDYDQELAGRIESRVTTFGADGKLLQNRDGGIYRATLGEKLLVPALAKMTNFVPEGGIWLNTQRPEWNDANNALAGHGLSIVTVCHLRRYFDFLSRWFTETKIRTFLVSRDIVRLMQELTSILSETKPVPGQKFNDLQRQAFVTLLSRAGCRFRETLYDRGLSGEKRLVQVSTCLELFDLCLMHIDHTIQTNRRDDGLYHSYNLIDYSLHDDSGFHVEPLFEMLEGQVAVLSSGLLKPAEAADVLDALRANHMYREDQQSYTLYPNRSLPRFTEKNRIQPELIADSQPMQQLMQTGDETIIRQDVHGDWHFNGDLRNADDLRRAIGKLGDDRQFQQWLPNDTEDLVRVFEATFNHRYYTGRSGSFFGYEGLGCIYWHMVSKLCLAAQESLVAAFRAEADLETLYRLRTHYQQIRDGLGLCKSPLEYGAFPTDPYSHTPLNGGVQQPGMTGQAKEDILARFCEVGVRVQQARVHFDPRLFETSEFLTHEGIFSFYSLDDQLTHLEIPADSFAFTFCQTPVIYQASDETRISVHFSNGETTRRSGNFLTENETQSLFRRDGTIIRIQLELERDALRGF